MKRKLPLKRGGSAQRAKERRQYAKQRAAYLAAHPFDQITIALHGLDEGHLRLWDLWDLIGGGKIPCSGLPDAAESKICEEPIYAFRVEERPTGAEARAGL